MEAFSWRAKSQWVASGCCGYECCWIIIGWQRHDRVEDQPYILYKWSQITGNNWQVNFEMKVSVTNRVNRRFPKGDYWREGAPEDQCSKTGVSPCEKINGHILEEGHNWHRHSCLSEWGQWVIILSICSFTYKPGLKMARRLIIAPDCL